MIVAAFVVAVVTVGGGGGAGQVRAMADHLERHPMATAVDLYKFLHQGVFGPGHMVESRSAAGRYLARELEGLESDLGDLPMCEELGGEPAMVRIHLQSLLRSDHDPVQLLDAFIESANRVQGDPTAMARAIDDAVAWLEEAGRTELAAGLRELGSEHRAAGFPALHHSEPYREAYHPAYRVLLRDLAETHGWCDPNGS